MNEKRSNQIKERTEIEWKDRKEMWFWFFSNYMHGPHVIWFQLSFFIYMLLRIAIK